MSSHSSHVWARAGALLTTAALLATGMFAIAPRSVAAVSTSVVISQIYGGGGNSGGIYTNDFVELFNRGTTTVSLAGWSIQYTSASGTGNFGSATNQITPLSRSLAPGQYLLVQEAAGANVFAALPTPDITDSTPINMSGTGGKVALVNTTTPLGCNGSSTPCSPAQLAQIVDLVGWDGANFYEGSGPAPATTNSTAALRKNGGAQDTDNNSADFLAGAPNPRNSAWPFGAVGIATPDTLASGDPTLLTVSVTPAISPAGTGIGAICDLTAIGGPAAQAFYDDGTNGDATAGDNVFTFATTVSSGATPGTQSLPCSVTDAQSRSVSTTITLTVIAIVPIGTVNGPVLDTDNGTAHVSPYVGQTVTVQGVIYETTLQAISNSTNTYKGFFIQNTSATADTDSNTSDGLFVFMSTASTISGPSGAYAPAVGDEVVLSGKVSEYYNMTELVAPLAVVRSVRGDVDIDAEVLPVVANPPAALADANRYWERLQGMRVQVPANSIVLGGRNVFSPADAEVWVAAPDSTIAQRADAYARRAFRDANPLDDNYDPAN